MTSLTPSQPPRNTDKAHNLGRVCLVGAGPGHPGLLTVLGLAHLKQAEVVIYDALIDPGLLELAPSGALRIDAGKRGGHHTLTQDEINQLLVTHAQAGKRVVRLKGGDPYLFGRGAEEAAFIARQGIEVEVVPGVTSGIAAPALAGIPVTHRKLASTVTFVTAHEDPAKLREQGSSSVDYAALARLIQAGGTVCVYMGVGRLKALVDTLLTTGLSGLTPAALVQWGTTPRQRSCRSTLEQLPGAAEKAQLGSPAIIVIGAVAGLEEPGLDYFTRRPLFGQRILVTRTRHQASQLKAQLADLGAEVLEAPTIALAPPADWTRVDAALRDLPDQQWLILTSPNAVDTLADRLAALGWDSRHLHGVRVAAVGDATADQLWEKLRLRPDFVPTQSASEALAGELLAREDLRGIKALLLRADIASPALPAALMQAGAQVREVVAYHTQPAENLPPQALTALRQRQLDWVTFTSSSTVKNLVRILGGECDLLSRCRLASIGPSTSQTLRELGLPIAAEARVHDIDGLVAAMIAAQPS